MTKTISGDFVRNPHVVELISSYANGDLISQILAMPTKTEILFDEAVRMASEESLKAFQARRIGNERGECNWFYTNFIQWISDQGYHIELTGDEFEAWALQDRVA